MKERIAGFFNLKKDPAVREVRLRRIQLEGEIQNLMDVVFDGDQPTSVRVDSFRQDDWKSKMSMLTGYLSEFGDLDLETLKVDKIVDKSGAGMKIQLKLNGNNKDPIADFYFHNYPWEISSVMIGFLDNNKQIKTRYDYKQNDVSNALRLSAIKEVLDFYLRERQIDSRISQL